MCIWISCKYYLNSGSGMGLKSPHLASSQVRLMLLVQKTAERKVHWKALTWKTSEQGTRPLNQMKNLDVSPIESWVWFCNLWMIGRDRHSMGLHRAKISSSFYSVSRREPIFFFFFIWVLDIKLYISELELGTRTNNTLFSSRWKVK